MYFLIEFGSFLIFQNKIENTLINPEAQYSLIIAFQYLIYKV